MCRPAVTLSVVTAAPVAAAPVTTAPTPMTAAPAPVTATAPTPMTSPPAPMAASPAPMSPPPPAPMSSPPMPPAVPPHLFGLQMLHLVAVGDSGTGILVRRRQRSVLRERVRHKRCCPCARGQRSRTRDKSKGEFQKMAAFHDIFLSVRASDAERVSPRRDERPLNLGISA